MSDDRRPARPHNRRPGGPGGRPGQRHAPRGFRGGERFGPETVWLFGLHAVRDALLNPERDRRRLILTRNAAMRLGDEAILAGGIEPEIVDPRKFTAPIDPQSVHQGAALEAAPLDWGRIEDLCLPSEAPETRDIVVLMDRVTDPHNVGAVLRSSEVFGAKAVIAPARHAAPETGALAKTASGALERQPYCRVKNLGTAMETLRDMGYAILGLDGEGEMTIAEALAEVPGGRTRPIALALGAEGPGLREKTRGLCDALVRIDSAADFASLNVSNAAAVALYATRNG